MITCLCRSLPPGTWWSFHVASNLHWRRGNSLFSTPPGVVIGTSAVSFPQDVGEYSTAWRRLVAAPRTPPPQLMGKDFSRRRHFTSHQTSLLETSDTLAVAVASLAFSVNGKPSDSVTGGVTSVRVTSAVEGSVSNTLRAWTDRRYRRNATEGTTFFNVKYKRCNWPY